MKPKAGLIRGLTSSVKQSIVCEINTILIVRQRSHNLGKFPQIFTVSMGVVSGIIRDIMHSFQNFIVRLIPNHPPPLETRIWKLVVRALLLGHFNSTANVKLVIQHAVSIISS